MTAASAAQIEYFAGNSLFAGIEPALLGEIAPELSIVRLEPGEVVFREGDPGDSLFLVGEGSVKISKRGRGGEQETLGFIQRDSFFGEMALLDGQPRSAMACATEPTLLGTVNGRTFQHILELAPSRLHMNFLRSVTERLRNVNSHFITEVMRTERLSLVGSMANSIIHDLKNPMCILRCCADLIAAESKSPRIHDLIKMQSKAVEGMLAMTQELLDYARGSTTLSKQSISVWGLLEELNQQSLQLLPGLNIQLVRTIYYQDEVEIDLPRFIRVLCNLIKNAREAMPGGGILTLTTELIDSQVVIRLADTGSGIPADLLPRIFEPFVTHGKKNGTGLGMAIAKSVVEAHGGQISVQSAVGSGTTVEIRLPAPEVATASAA